MSQDIVDGTLSPAYGRDYRSKEGAITDFLLGKDFVLRNVASKWDNKYCSIRDCKAGDMVKLRYDRQRKVVFYAITDMDILNAN